jgi:hypothetical protein
MKEVDNQDATGADVCKIVGPFAAFGFKGGRLLLAQSGLSRNMVDR